VNAAEQPRCFPGSFRTVNPFLRLVLGGPWFPSSASCLITEARIIEAHFDGTDGVVTFHTVARRHYSAEFSVDCINWITEH
jgi:hypothetical protein